ncbi:DUF2963 domain-containing protein [bacterium]|nr:DUF2963 domain-containing protein [bacterium]
MSTQNTYRNIINSAYKETGLQGVTTDKTHKNEKEIVYRKNGKSIDKVIEFDSDTGCKIRTTHYDYFNDNKIRSIDEYDKETGKKLRTINYVLYKSIDEYDFETGEKLRTINYNVKDDTKISSVQEYDIASGKITKIFIFKKDGKTICAIKKINPETNEVTDYLNREDWQNPIQTADENAIYCDNIKNDTYKKDDSVENLIDHLYQNCSKKLLNLKESLTGSKI